MIQLANRRIETDLFCKPTDKHQYLLHSSSHPFHTKRSIPYSLALRLRRICSTETSLIWQPSNGIKELSVQNGDIKITVLKNKFVGLNEYLGMKPYKNIQLMILRKPTESRSLSLIIQLYPTSTKSSIGNNPFFTPQNVLVKSLNKHLSSLTVALPTFMTSWYLLNWKLPTRH